MAKRARTDEATQDASASLPDPQAPAPNLAPELGFTAQDLIQQQEQLEADANAAYPFQLDTCTHALGPIRQPVYACRTCGGGGVCAACSVMCHGEHELVELFHKRDFRCDCGTPSLYRERTDLTDTDRPRDAQPCALRKHEPNKGWDEPNHNKYTHNFQGHFCICERGKSYDPQTEEETMYQCLVCEEWYHESCTSLGTRRILSADMFEHLVCDACVQHPDARLLRIYAGAQHWMLLASEGPDAWDGVSTEVHGDWKLYGRASSASTDPETVRASNAAPAAPPASDVAPLGKRARASCTSPTEIHPSVRRPKARTDVFLDAAFRQRLCDCADCEAAWRAQYPYVYEEETTYEPPTEMDDAASTTSSTYDRAVAALGQLPRVQMLESLRAYEQLRNALYEHLRPYAERHEPVDEEAVRAFFREHKARRSQSKS
ncbi:RING-type E3 ubiquitin transferase [Malassezia brasiliensis]|uniref:RING-type E3 ubiquitin transferase n=1 Tax=Malassezia brasiliensis TaxID=1821822 RepID=A0AAF0DZ51_9BASI|nr:RING-type E3 ubiquitin transferase [Malassezia brasiliensis]